MEETRDPGEGNFNVYLLIPTKGLLKRTKKELIASFNSLEDARKFYEYKRSNSTADYIVQ